MNRQQRRKLMKQIKQKDLGKVFNFDEEKSFDSLPEGTKVKILPEKCVMHNGKRNRFIKENADKVMTICYDPKFTNNPHIYSLVEDTNEPKWLWNHSELEVVDTTEERKE